jgi:hypothetical protein
MSILKNIALPVILLSLSAQLALDLMGWNYTHR